MTRIGCGCGEFIGPALEYIKHLDTHCGVGGDALTQAQLKTIGWRDAAHHVLADFTEAMLREHDELIGPDLASDLRTAITVVRTGRAL